MQLRVLQVLYIRQFGTAHVETFETIGTIKRGVARVVDGMPLMRPRLPPAHLPTGTVRIAAPRTDADCPHAQRGSSHRRMHLSKERWDGIMFHLSADLTVTPLAHRS